MTEDLRHHDTETTLPFSALGASGDQAGFENPTANPTPEQPQADRAPAQAVLVPRVVPDPQTGEWSFVNVDPSTNQPVGEYRPFTQPSQPVPTFAMVMTHDVVNGYQTNIRTRDPFMHYTAQAQGAQIGLQLAARNGEPIHHLLGLTQGTEDEDGYDDDYDEDDRDNSPLNGLYEQDVAPRQRRERQPSERSRSPRRERDYERGPTPGRPERVKAAFWSREGTGYALAKIALISVLVTDGLYAVGVNGKENLLHHGIKVSNYQLYSKGFIG